jgi:hypothetical protein
VPKSVQTLRPAVAAAKITVVAFSNDNHLHAVRIYFSEPKVRRSIHRPEATFKIQKGMDSSWLIDGSVLSAPFPATHPHTRWRMLVRVEPFLC